MAKLYSTRQVAEKHETSSPAIRKIAQRRRIQPHKVDEINGAYFWRKGQIAQLKPGPVGWPKGRRRGASKP